MMEAMMESWLHASKPDLCVDELGLLQVEGEAAEDALRVVLVLLRVGRHQLVGLSGADLGQQHLLHVTPTKHSDVLLLHLFAGQFAPPRCGPCPPAHATTPSFGARPSPR